MAIRPPDEGIGTRPLPDQEFEKPSLLLLCRFAAQPCCQFIVPVGVD